MSKAQSVRSWPILNSVSAALLAASAAAQVSAITGNHGVSTGDIDWSVVQIDPAAFGIFISPLGTGRLTVAVDGGAPQPLSSLAWTGDSVFPAVNLRASAAGGAVTIELNGFAPLSPFYTLQGFFPVLIAQFDVASLEPAGGANHSVVFEYDFTCSGFASACIGSAPPPRPAAAAAASAASAGYPSAASAGYPAPAVYNISAQVFVGASGGDAVSAACPPPALAHPPPINFFLVANDSAAGGADCPFEGWGPGASLQDCELACFEDANCTTINFDAHSGDCVFRICSDPARPAVSPNAGYNVYSTVQPKGPFPQLCASAAAQLQPGEAKRAALFVGQHDPAGKYADAYPDAASLFAYVSDNADALAAQHSAFIASIPTTGNATTDRSVRFFLAPPVLLTKGVGALTSTMGYVEMCPRDGFWATWLHAFMWPALEADMIREFVAFQCNATTPECDGIDGKIPTTILPLIYRDDNIDVTAYFVLRIGRYLRASGDVALLREVYPAVRRALAYLLSRRVGDGSGLPAALEHSQWADWLDVDYMIGRKYAPHFCFIYLAAMRDGAQFAAQLNQTADAAEYSAALEEGLAFMLRPYAPVVNASASGMWNARGFFQDVWWDGHVTNYTLTDNSIGSFFGLVDDAHASATFAWLTASGVEGPFGMRDFYPYFPFADDPPGQYGNGGTYGWQACIEAVNRMQHGDFAGGERIWTKMSTTMLYRTDQSSKNQAYEYMNSDTGVDMGAFPFGGDGACFMIASLGYSEFFRSGAGAFSLVLRSASMRPRAGLTLLRPILDGAGVAALLRIAFDGSGGAPAASLVVAGVGAGAGGTGRHTWREVDGSACRSAHAPKGTAAAAWSVECGLGGALGGRVGLPTLTVDVRFEE